MMNLFDVLPGALLVTVEGREAEVVENMGDGQWLEVRFRDSGEVELVHSQDVKSVKPGKAE
jgi:hypothetical protein